ncbi:hypothetical protein CDD80_5686 [Ophiocordyceps camponoti-rufipedis]|uniref:Uncharacterized protein n=1 Tax=Ophiocordyceps camponoti-rufipedis TaxID=2004952 RepID=A0A2C5YTB6_9HYPO|nr:hypothetical protein CDD80_5686 [Ophiocordyceps camponoti-rufipedis]
MRPRHSASSPSIRLDRRLSEVFTRRKMRMVSPPAQCPDRKEAKSAGARCSESIRHLLPQTYCPTFCGSPQHNQASSASHSGHLDNSGRFTQDQPRLVVSSFRDLEISEAKLHSAVPRPKLATIYRSDSLRFEGSRRGAKVVLATNR